MYYTGVFIVTILILHCTLVSSLPHSPHTSPALRHLRQLQEALSFYLLFVYKTHQPSSLTISSIHPPSSHKYPPPHCTVLSLITNSKGFLNVSLIWVHFTLVSSIPSVFLPYPFFPPLYYSTAFNIYHYILCLSRCYVFWYYLLSHSISFPFSPELLRVLLLQTCTTYKFEYDHAWFCVYVYLLDLSSTYERKHVAFVFLNLAYFT
jgi:hypothetical protein